MKEISFEKELIELEDKKYKLFQEKLIPTLDKNKIIGVRTPYLRKFASKIYKEKSNDEIDSFLSSLPHRFYEEDNLHILLIDRLDRKMEKISKFSKYVDNWATSDLILTIKNLDKEENFALYIDDFLISPRAYTVRIGIGLVMKYFLGEKFSKDFFEKVIKIKSDEYYVNMMRAWFFTEALIYNYEDSFPIIKDNLLDKFTHNKTIQKSIESYKISNDKKEVLKKYRKA